MRIVILCAALACLAVPVLAADEGAAKAEQEIKAQAQEFTAAWQKHDAALLAAFYAQDGDLVTGTGRAYSGRDGIEETLRGAFDGGLKDSTFSLTVEKVKLVKGDVAIVDYDAQLKRSDADAEPLKFHMVSVLVKQGGKWLNQTSRSIVYTQQ